MSNNDPKQPLLYSYYDQYLTEQDTAAYLQRVSAHYTVATLQRLVSCGGRESRRGSVLALGLLSDYESNHVLGRALVDKDRCVRTLAENSIRSVWQKAGNNFQRERLRSIVNLIGSKRFEEAVTEASDLVEQAPWFAEVWNQRALAYYHTERFSESIHDCRQSLEINPYHFGAAAGMGQCHLRLKDRASALECFRRALRLNPSLEGVRAQVIYLQKSLKND